MAVLLITATEVGPGETTATCSIVQVGESIITGQLGYYDSTTDRYLKSDASDPDKGAEGMFLNNGDTDEYVMFISKGRVRLGTILSVGETYVAGSAIAGTTQPIADLVSTDYVTHIGVAETTSILNISINNTGTQIP